jgi:hypothetical protein
LTKQNKTAAAYFTHHAEVFYYLRKLQKGRNFSLKFSVDHIDAHADLGLGDASFKYIATSILKKPINERAYPNKINGWEGLSAGNYLAFLVAWRWVQELTYVSRKDWLHDIQWFNFKDFEPKTEIIQLKEFTDSQMDQMINGNMEDMRKMASQ